MKRRLVNLCECGCGKEARNKFIQGHQNFRWRKTTHYKVAKNGCWIWLLHTVGGYGRFSVNGKRGVLAHRHYYEKLRGKIPSGMVIDHLCGNKSCVNPDHLEIVTRAENSSRPGSKHFKGGDLHV